MRERTLSTGQRVESPLREWPMRSPRTPFFWLVNVRERNVTVSSAAERTLEGVNGCGQGPQGNVTEAKKIVSCGAGSAGVLAGAEEKVEGEGEAIRRGADGRQRRSGTGQGNGHGGGPVRARVGPGWGQGSALLQARKREAKR
jgi:hypothetical protein